MNWLTILIQLLPTIFKLMGFAEAFFPKTGAGADKKALVTGVAQAVVEGITAVSTGGQKETWEKIAEPMSIIIDGAASIMYPKDNI